MTRRVALLLIAVSLAVAADGPASHRTVIMVRHAERAAPTGDPGLNEKGIARAQTLAYVLKDVKLHAIYTSHLIRTKETAAPVASLTGATVEAIPAEPTAALVAKLRQLPAGTTALVVHHSNTIPQIADELGAGPVAPIPETEYDRMLVITLPASGKPTVMTLRYGGR